MTGGEKINRDSIHKNAVESIDKKAKELFDLAESRPLKEYSKGPFPSRQDTISLTGDDILGEPKFFYDDPSGRIKSCFFVRDKYEFGFFDERYDKIRYLAEEIIRTKPFNTGLSSKFLEEVIFDWWAKNFNNKNPDLIIDFIIERCKDAVRDRHIVIPLEFIEIEKPFKIGDIIVSPMDKEMIRSMSRVAQLNNSSESDRIKDHFIRLEREMGHLTVIHVFVKGDPSYSKQYAEDLAFRMSEIFRFISPAACTWNLSFPCFPYGCYKHRSITVFDIGDNNVAAQSGYLLDRGIFNWRMPFSEIDSAMKAGLLNCAAFFRGQTLTPFQLRVKKSMSAFSEGIASYNTNNKLIYAMSALEHLFLKDEQEPIQSGVADRIAFLISNDSSERKRIVRNFKKAYGLRSKQLHHLSTVDDEEVLSQFFINAWSAVNRSIKLMPSYKTHLEFIEAIEELKYR